MVQEGVHRFSCTGLRIRREIVKFLFEAFRPAADAGAGDDR
jgi:hypothetical protein